MLRILSTLVFISTLVAGGPSTEKMRSDLDFEINWYLDHKESYDDLLGDAELLSCYGSELNDDLPSDHKPTIEDLLNIGPIEIDREKCVSLGRNYNLRVIQKDCREYFQVVEPIKDPSLFKKCRDMGYIHGQETSTF